MKKPSELIAQLVLQLRLTGYVDVEDADRVEMIIANFLLDNNAEIRERSNESPQANREAVKA